ncbi:MAG: class I SAM-dependent methyltransferase [Chloroflexi bacterium]|nr:class I SAM-dependent methyltransferase [Chloroflexota bacterium]
MKRTRKRLMLAWQWMVRSGFRLLYNEFAWAYDAVSWLVSAGEWKTWQRAAEPWIKAGRGLEIGCGRGDLLIRQLAQGRAFCGLDLSPAMLRTARRKAERQGVPTQLCRGRAELLPFAADTFATVITTFPTAFAVDPATWREIYRILSPGGVWLWVDGGQLVRPALWARLTRWAFRLTRVSAEGVVPRFTAMQDAGFVVRSQTLNASPRSRISVIVAQKPGGGGGATIG